MKTLFRKIDRVLNRVLWKFLTGSGQCSENCMLEGITKIAKIAKK